MIRLWYVLFLVASWAQAQTFGADAGKAQDIRPQDVIQWDAFQASPEKQGIVVGLRMTSRSGWSIYAKNLKFSGPAGYTLDNLEPPSSLRQKDPLSDEMVDVYTGGEFSIRFAGPVEWKAASFPVTVQYIGCTTVICLFPHSQVIEVPFVSGSASETSQIVSSSATPVFVAPIGEKPELAPIPCNDLLPRQAKASGDLETKLANLFSNNRSSYSLLLILVLLGGLLSNLTPCVYPMIPITLRLLARQGRSPTLSASFYALGIVVSYTTLALVAALSGGLFGKLLASPIFNSVFAVMMALLGVSMLGFGDFSKFQALGSRLGSGKPSFANTFLMGAGAGLVAAPCTGPILAALLAYTARGEQGIAASVFLMVVYSIGFALPYVLLGGAAAKVSAVKVAPAVQVATKIAFASIMLALAFYYLRIPFYDFIVFMRGKWQPSALAFSFAGLFLLAIWSLNPSLQMQKLSLLIPSVTLGVGIFASTQWLTNQVSVLQEHEGQKKIAWIKNEQEGFEQAKLLGRPLLIDMWAEWCEACKKMDATTFADPEVIAAVEKFWVPVKLDHTETTKENDALQQKYQLTSLPALVLLSPDANLEKMRLISGYVDKETLLTHLSSFCQTSAE